MDQYLAICQIRDKLRNTIGQSKDKNTTKQLEEIDAQLKYFLDRGIDFKEIVDGLDDGIFITNHRGEVLYVNPAYTRNTGINPDMVLNHNVYELMGPGRAYTGGAVPDVLKTGKPAFRLSTAMKNGNPQLSYVIGTPIFDKDGQLHQVVALSRPVMSLKSLKTDFNAFLKELQTPDKPSVNNAIKEGLRPYMIGKETTLANIWTLISHVAPSDATVLITGESGAGKEVIADEIYRNSKRNKKPYIKINCASIPAQLLESELFGYEKGAFSGANSKGKPGLFEMANDGTLLLDEIGDMPMDLQVKLLRAIQSQEITRIGGTKPVKLNIRFLALTNSDLKEKIEKGTFRQDLYYRLNVIPIHVPPLRERIADLEELCECFIQRFSEKYGTAFRLTNRQYEYMKAYSWPGNIRELENIIEYLVLCSSGVGQVEDKVITGLLNLSKEPQTEEDIQEDLSYEPKPQAVYDGMDFNEEVARFEKRILEEAIASCRNLREVGQKLNINASTVSRKIKQYNIEYLNQR